MRYLLTFAPWIVFAAVSAIAPPSGWGWAALAGLVVAIGVVLRQRLARVPADALILETGSAVFFIALAGLAFTVPDSPMRHYAGAAALGWLALIAWGTLAAGRPFTLGIARLSTPAEVWGTPIFRRVNVLITLVWAVSFTATAALLAAAVAAGLGSAVTVAIQVAGFVIPAVFTARYPAAVRARFARLGAETPAESVPE